jgi:hypothetical protein
MLNFRGRPRYKSLKKAESGKEYMADEGSVFVDGIDTDAEVSSEESSEESSQEETQNETEETSTDEAHSKSSEEDKETDKESGESQEKVTDKGTKLDENPLSAANQLRANAEAKARQYEQILTNPVKFREYAKAAGFTDTEIKKAEDDIEELDFKPESFKTVDDVANAFNKLAKTNKSYADEISNLKGQLEGTSSANRTVAIATSVKEQITAVQQKYDELNPNSKNFNPELEKEVGDLYHSLDYDPNSGRYKGQVNLLTLTDRIMKAAGYGRKAGSKEAQTAIREKGKGQVVTGKGVGVSKDESKMTPEQVIAKRISKIM